MKTDDIIESPEEETVTESQMGENKFLILLLCTTGRGEWSVRGKC